MRMAARVPRMRAASGRAGRKIKSGGWWSDEGEERRLGVMPGATLIEEKIGDGAASRPGSDVRPSGGCEARLRGKPLRREHPVGACDSGPGNETGVARKYVGRSPAIGRRTDGRGPGKSRESDSTGG